MARVRKTLLPVLIVTAASAIYALGFVWCYAPNGIAFGGITGVALGCWRIPVENGVAGEGYWLPALPE